eukprot:s1695_g8.t1
MKMGSSVCWKQKKQRQLLPMTRFLPWQMLDRWQKKDRHLMQHDKKDPCNAVHVEILSSSSMLVHWRLPAFESDLYTVH